MNYKEFIERIEKDPPGNWQNTEKIVDDLIKEITQDTDHIFKKSHYELCEENKILKILIINCCEKIKKICNYSVEELIG